MKKSPSDEHHHQRIEIVAESMSRQSSFIYYLFIQKSIFCRGRQHFQMNFVLSVVKKLFESPEKLPLVHGSVCCCFFSSDAMSVAGF